MTLTNDFDYDNSRSERALDPLAPLRELAVGSSLTEVEAVLRQVKDGLVGLDPLAMTRVRGEMVDQLRRIGVQGPAQWADSVLATSQDSTSTSQQGTSLIFDDPAPWPEPVSGEALLDELAATYRRFVVLPDLGFEALALWTVLTYVFDSFVICPLLALVSPVKRCGKSTVLQILQALCRRPLLASNITTAALFRVIEAHKPTLLIDEVDTQLRDNEELRGIINGGHAKNTAWVLRVVGDDFEPRAFSVWAPKVLALIGSLPDTLDDRSVRVRMRRRAATEVIEKLRRDRLGQFEIARRKAVRWANDHGAALGRLDPSLPDLKNDRAVDNWRPLVTIADCAGARWGELARKAAVELSKFEADDEDTWRILLLEDLRTLFSRRAATQLTSKEIIEFLVSLDERPWPTSAKGRPMTPAQLASLLKPFEVRPGSIRIDSEKTKKGYSIEDLREPFRRYLPAPGNESAQTAQASPAASNSHADGSIRPGGVAARAGTVQATILIPTSVPASSGTLRESPADSSTVAEAGTAVLEVVPAVPAENGEKKAREETTGSNAPDDDDDGDPEGGPSEGGSGAPAVEYGAEPPASPVAGLIRKPEIVTSDRGVEAIRRRLANSHGPVGLDLETTGLDPRIARTRLLTLNVAGDPVLVDCFQINPQPLFAELKEKVLVGHHLAFDLSFLKGLGFEAGSVSDTYLMSQVLHAGEGERSGFHTLEAVLKRSLGIVVDKTLQTSDWSQNELSPAQLEYAANDVSHLSDLHRALRRRLDEDGLLAVADLENRCLPAIVWMSSAGVPLDEAAWRALHEENVARTAAAKAGLDDAVQGFGLEGINWNSPKQVQESLQRIGVAIPNARLQTLKDVDHPVVRAIAAFREASSRTRRYGPDFAQIVDGRIYPSWRQIGAESGRMSCSTPNLQAIPREDRYRACFTPPKGRVLVRADYSQIELRFLAAHTGDARLLDAYAKGEDLHTATARALLGHETVSKSERQLAKAVNFGLMFGMAASTLRDYARTLYGVSLSHDDAGQLREAFFRTYPGVRAWHGRVAMDLRCGCLHEARTALGRRRLFGHNPRFTEVVNHPIQGGAADGLKWALALLWERRAECPGAFPVACIHDEIVVEASEGQVDEAAAWLEGAMKDGMTPLLGPVPVVVDTTIRRRA